MRRTTGRSPRRARVCYALVLAGTLLSSPARADLFDSTRSELLREVSHHIDITVDRGFASLVVRRTVFNGGRRHDQAIFALDLPPGAAATGLRTLGHIGGRPYWFKGELLERETAAARYRELTGFGDAFPKDPALLSWRSQQQLALQVFPCEPGANKTVEYTLLLPTAYHEGLHRFRLPRLGTSTVPSMVKVRAAQPGDTLLVDDSPVRPGTELSFATAEDMEIAIQPSAQPPITGALAILPLGPSRVLSQARIDIAAKLSTVPARARVVVLIDASRSVEEVAKKASIAAAKAYLGHFPDGTAEVMVFDRTVRPVHGKLVPTSKAVEDLASLVIQPGNGSFADLALERAASMLATSPGGERRIVVFTDTLTRDALTTTQLGTRFGAAGGVVHVVVPSFGGPWLTRDDEHGWSGVAKSTGGLVWQSSACDDPETARVFTELARPVRLHNARIQGGFLPEEMTSLDTIQEGEGLWDLRIHVPAGNTFSVEGDLWTRRVHSTTAATDEEARRWAAMVFGSPVIDELTDKEMMVLAKRGGAVSPVTSYLAIEPGVRPSTEGLADMEARGIGLGAIGTIGHGSGYGTAGGRVDTFDPMRWLHHAISMAWAACGAPSGMAKVEVETTVDEVVDVPVLTSPTPVSPAVSTCLREAIWALDLPTGFRQERASYELTLDQSGRK